MSDGAVEGCIARLAGDLTPVARTASPWPQALAWFAVVGTAALVLARIYDASAMLHRLEAAPDMWLAMLGSTLTAVLGAVATFQLSLPDRSPWWSALPLPGLALWLGATGMGCLRTWVLPDTSLASLGEARDCFVFIVGMSIPLSMLTVLLVRRAFPLRPDLTAATGGIAVAAAAATLLNFCHPFDVGAIDIAVHVCAVVLVIGANRLLGGRILQRRGTDPRRRAGP